MTIALKKLTAMLTVRKAILAEMTAQEMETIMKTVMVTITVTKAQKDKS